MNLAATKIACGASLPLPSVNLDIVHRDIMDLVCACLFLAYL
jgi:hypothetical protein